MSKGTSILNSKLPKLDTKFFLKNRLSIGALVLGLILLTIGLFQLISSSESGNQIEIVPNTGSESSSEIVVDVGGAVNKPGVYYLDSQARVAKAIEAAGNFSANADLLWIAKNLNLAAKLTDGSKIYIPAKGETGGVSNIGKETISSKININTATQAQLESLPAIGPVTASKIISSRPYNSIEELLTKKVIGKATFEKIKDLLSLF